MACDNVQLLLVVLFKCYALVGVGAYGVCPVVLIPETSMSKCGSMCPSSAGVLDEDPDAASLLQIDNARRIEKQGGDVLAVWRDHASASPASFRSSHVRKLAFNSSTIAVELDHAMVPPVASRLSRSDKLTLDFTGSLVQLDMHWRFDRLSSDRTTCIVVGSGLFLMCLCWLVDSWRSENEVGMEKRKALLLCLCYCIASSAMNILNKRLVDSVGTPTLVTSAQMLMTVIIVLTWESRHFVLSTGKLSRGKLTGDVAEIAKWTVVPFIFFGMLVASFHSYKHLTLSMLMMVRGLGPLLTIPLESVVMPADRRPFVTLGMLLALLVMLGGTCLYVQEIRFPSLGVLLALANMFFSIADRITQRRLLSTECKSLSTEMCIFLNNAIGFVPTIILAFALGELHTEKLRKWLEMYVWVLLILSGIIGTAIACLVITVQRTVSATSFMVLQNFVRLAVVAAGIIIFNDPIGWPFQVLGLFISFGAALWYGREQVSGVAELRLRMHQEANKTPRKDDLPAAHGITEPPEARAFVSNSRPSPEAAQTFRSLIKGPRWQ